MKFYIICADPNCDEILGEIDESQFDYINLETSCFHIIMQTQYCDKHYPTNTEFDTIKNNIYNNYEVILEKKDVEELYYTLNLSLKKTSKKLGISENKLLNFMKDNNMKRRTLSESSNCRGKNHPMYGKKRSDEFKEKMSKKMKGKNNPMYVNNWNDLTINARHRRMRNLINIPKICLECNLNERLELCNLNHKYNNIIDEWKFICSSCHKRYDIKNKMRPNPLENFKK